MGKQVWCWSLECECWTYHFFRMMMMVCSRIFCFEEVVQSLESSLYYFTSYLECFWEQMARELELYLHTIWYILIFERKYLRIKVLAFQVQYWKQDACEWSPMVFRVLLWIVENLILPLIIWYLYITWNYWFYQSITNKCTIYLFVSFYIFYCCCFKLVKKKIKEKS